ncbi:hypothetical protein OCU04_003158 [Sclerotinia nivalis]|uniref:Uncharacterized protein n=1 Tax=Sclerotinia nivalis TaxID=352851 RepID=A0A9X0AV39_9HELO|nr:hypothetical protein OCU04_003158 [Sclerotinia nivalis]
MTNTCEAGLEKTLRLIQALCQICAFYPRVLVGLLAGMGMAGKGVVVVVSGGGGNEVRILEGLWRARREVVVGMFGFFFLGGGSLWRGYVKWSLYQRLRGKALSGVRILVQVCEMSLNLTP